MLKWADTSRYFGVYVTTASCFKCVFENAKRTFYKSANNIFGKVGRVASEEVVLRLIQSKCMPCMLYCLEACPVNKTQTNSLQFAVTSFMMKLFKTRSNDIVNECMSAFNFQSVSVAVSRRKLNFLANFRCSNNKLCSIFSDTASKELLNVSETLR